MRVQRHIARLIAVVFVINVSGCYYAADKLGLSIGYRYELPQAANDVATYDPNSNPRALPEVIEGCSKALDYYEVGAAGVTTLTMLIALTGAAAGGIVVPVLTAAAAHANRGLIAGWGGVSGVANSAQAGLGQVPAHDLQIRESIRTEYLKAVGEFATASGVNGQRAALFHMITACTAYGVQPIANANVCTGSMAADANGAGTVKSSCIESGAAATCIDVSNNNAKLAAANCVVSAGSISFTGATHNGTVLWSQP